MKKFILLIIAVLLIVFPQIIFAEECPSGYVYDWTAPGFPSENQIQTCLKRETNVLCSYLDSSVCNRTTYLSIPLDTKIGAYQDNQFWIFAITHLEGKYYYSWRLLDSGIVKRTTTSTSVGFVTKYTQDANNLAFVATSESNNTLDIVVESKISSTSTSCSNEDIFGEIGEKLATEGSCIDDYGTHSDICLDDDILSEYYCGPDSKTCFNTKYRCTDYGFTGCIDGQCVEIGESCTDSDGGKDYYTKGQITYVFDLDAGFISKPYDYCDGNYVIEFYCKSEVERHMVRFECPYGCEDGACVEESPAGCSDTDWFGDSSEYHLQRLETKGTCTDDAGAHTDVCLDDNRLQDYYCGPLAHEEKSCDGSTTYYCTGYGFDKCVDGACVYTGNCEDTDRGKDYYKKGSVTYGGKIYQDVCIFDTDSSSHYVNEYFCVGNEIGTSEYICLSGCEDGECISYELYPYQADVSYCVDKDGFHHQTTGNGATARWFVWNGCTRNKYYNVNPGETLTFRATTDTYSCQYPNFYVYEYENGVWVNKKYFNLEDGSKLTHHVTYTPSSNKIKIYSPSCFYLKVLSEGPLTLECTSNSDCEYNEFCEFPEGECYATGICLEKPDVCTLDYNPVCGCNDETYSNDCSRQSSGVSKNYDGECKPDYTITFCRPSTINKNTGEVDCYSTSDVTDKLEKEDDITVTISYAAPSMVLMTNFEENFEKINIKGKSAAAYVQEKVCLIVRSDLDGDGIYETGGEERCSYNIKPDDKIETSFYVTTSNPLLIAPTAGVMAVDYLGRPLAECIDTDGGVNYYEKGSVNPSPCYEEPCPATGVWIDKCLDSWVLLEYSCDNLDGKRYACPNGCQNGACIKGDFDIKVRTDKYTYSPGDVVRIFVTLTAESSINLGKADVEFKVTGPTGRISVLEGEMVGVGASSCAKSTSTDSYTCTVTNIYSFIAKHPLSEDALLGVYSVYAKARLGEISKEARTKFEVNRHYFDYVDITITPREQSTIIGRPVSYRVTIKDNHPIPKCGTSKCTVTKFYNYKTDVYNLPYNSVYPELVSVPAGESSHFDIKIYPSPVKTLQGVATAVRKTEVEDFEEERATSVSGAYLTTSYPVVGEPQPSVGGGGGSGSIPIEVAAFKFTVAATLLDTDETIRDSTSAVLYVKYSDTPEPPQFPEEETITVYLKKGWNLFNLPGKGTRFVEGTCSLEKRPFAFVYLHDERRFISIEEAALRFGVDGLFEHLSTHSFWAYSYENCEIGVKVNKYSTYSGLALVRGWNMIGTTRDMVGETMNSIKGNCIFEKIYTWDSDTQQWVKRSEDDLIEKLSYGIVVKTLNACNLKTNSIQPAMVP